MHIFASHAVSHSYGNVVTVYTWLHSHNFFGFTLDRHYQSPPQQVHSLSLRVCLPVCVRGDKKVWRVSMVDAVVVDDDKSLNRDRLSPLPPFCRSIRFPSTIVVVDDVKLECLCLVLICII